VPIELDESKKTLVNPIPMMAPITKPQPIIPQSQEQLIPLNIDVNTNVKANYVRKVGNTGNLIIFL
jgi:hypothetical protein